MPDRKTLYLVDGHAIVFRSYYAFINRPLVNSKGEETSAVFGFLNIILSLITSEKPDYLAVVFDTAAKRISPGHFCNFLAKPDDQPGHNGAGNGFKSAD